MKLLQALIGFLGRLCVSAPFIVVSIGIFLNWQSAESSFVSVLCNWSNSCLGDERLRPFFEMAINASSLILLSVAICTIVSALLVLLGMSVRLGSFILLCICIPSTLLFHPFWMLQGAECEMQFALFMKNASIIGGLLLLLAYGSKKKKTKKDVTA